MGNKTRGGGGGTQKKDRSSRQKCESTSNKEVRRKTVGLKEKEKNQAGKMRHEEAVENEKERQRRSTREFVLRGSHEIVHQSGTLVVVCLIQSSCCVCYCFLPSLSVNFHLGSFVTMCTQQ